MGVPLLINFDVKYQSLQTVLFLNFFRCLGRKTIFNIMYIYKLSVLAIL